MARARNLKPGFFRDARVVSCRFESRLLFQGLWCLADYMGRMKYVPAEIKMEIFPADNVDIGKCMEELERVGLIQKYLDDSGSTLVQIPNFTKHQNPHQNERFDKDKNPLPHLPGPKAQKPPEAQKKPDTKQQVEDALRVLREYSESNPGAIGPLPSSLFPLTDSLQEQGASRKRSASKQGTRLPEGWEPSEALRAWTIAERPGMDVQRTLDSFTDYWRAVAGAKGCKLDWDATWRNWVRREDGRRTNGTGSGGNQPRESAVQRSARIAREQLEKLGYPQGGGDGRVVEAPG